MPFFQLFLLPQKFFSLPMRSPIIPQKEIDIKTVTNESFEVVDHKAHCLAGHRETKMAIALELNMKTSSRPTKA
jgi:hypothetical protein